MSNTASASPLLLAILAAGGSRRLGQPKQLLSLGGESLIRRQSRVALAAQVGPVAVILGCHATECAAAIADMPVARHVNPHWTEGLGASIRHAAQVAVAADAAGLLLLHGDQYRITAGDLQSLHAAWTDSQQQSARAAIHGDEIGPPVIFPRRCFAELLKLGGDAGARRMLTALPANSLRPINLPNAAYDLDSPEQWAALCESARDWPT